MIGACIAAIQERRRLRRMYGYGSNGLWIKGKLLTAIHVTSTTTKEIMKDQLPPKEATLSASLFPTDLLVSNSLNKFLLINSCSLKLSTMSCSIFVSAPLSLRIVSSTYRIRNLLRSLEQMNPSSLHAGN